MSIHILNDSSIFLPFGDLEHRAINMRKRSRGQTHQTHIGSKRGCETYEGKDVRMIKPRPDFEFVDEFLCQDDEFNWYGHISTRTSFVFSAVLGSPLRDFTAT